MIQMTKHDIWYEMSLFLTCAFLMMADLLVGFNSARCLWAGMQSHLRVCCFVYWEGEEDQKRGLESFFLSFFFGFGIPNNHWTKRVVCIWLITWTQKTFVLDLCRPGARPLIMADSLAAGKNSPQCLLAGMHPRTNRSEQNSLTCDYQGR